MTDPIIPDRIADELLAGSADHTEIAAELRGVAGLAAAARQAPTEGELAGMTAAVAAFQAAVTAPASAAGAASQRSVFPMIRTRIPKRAAIIGAVTVVFAGTAAAAAADVVPSPWASPRVAQTKPFATTTTASPTTLGETTVPTTEAPTTTEDPATTEGSNTTEASATTESGSTETTTFLYPGRDYGLCTAWTNGAPKRITNPAFSYLVDQAIADAAAAEAPADEAATRAAVDAYCEKVIADKKGLSVDDADADADDADDAEETQTATSVSDRPTGNGKGNGNGKSNGQGHGKP